MRGVGAEHGDKKVAVFLGAALSGEVVLQG